MSGVDVLAELDRRIAISRELCVVRDITETPPGLADLVEARDAVAGLIEAIKPLAELDLRPDGFDKRPDDQTIYARDRSTITVGDVRRAAAALARCRGGDA